MTTIASIRDSEFGTTCDKCGMALIVPEWSEYVERRARPEFLVLHTMWFSV